LTFASKFFVVQYLNNSKLDYEDYTITKVSLNGNTIFDNKSKNVIIKREDLLRNATYDMNTLEITLDKK